MKRTVFILLVFIIFVLAILAGCTSSKKYGELEERNETLKGHLDSANRLVEDLEKRISELEARVIESTESAEEAAKVKQAYEKLAGELSVEVEEGRVQIEQLRGRIQLSIAQELFFDSGSVDIRPEGQEMLVQIGNILKEIPEKNVRIEGHTDTVRIGSALKTVYPTNWNLGAARAVNVTRFLHEKAGIDPLRLSAVSYGQYRPVASNKTKAGRAKNRRIEIILVDRDMDLAARMREYLAQ